MTKGQAEAKISEAISKFEIEYNGRGPKQIRTLIVQDLIIIRLKGFLSQSEQKLAENSQGVELLKKVRTMNDRYVEPPVIGNSTGRLTIPFGTSHADGHDATPDVFIVYLEMASVKLSLKEQ